MLSYSIIFEIGSIKFLNNLRKKKKKNRIISTKLINNSKASLSFTTKIIYQNKKHSSIWHVLQLTKTNKHSWLFANKQQKKAIITAERAIRTNHRNEWKIQEKKITIAIIYKASIFTTSFSSLSIQYHKFYQAKIIFMTFFIYLIFFPTSTRNSIEHNLLQSISTLLCAIFF